MIYRLFLLLIGCSMASGAFGQSSRAGGSFVVEGEIPGRDTGVVMLWYIDSDKDLVEDTVTLDRGKFRVSGTVNRACEAILWTDIRVKAYDDPTSLRFLLEPGKISILFKVNRSITSGSKLQQEKERWDEKRAVWLSARRRIWDTLAHPETFKKGVDSATAANRMNSLSARGDSLGRIIRALDVKYVKATPIPI